MLSGFLFLASKLFPVWQAFEGGGGAVRVNKLFIHLAKMKCLEKQDYEVDNGLKPHSHLGC